MLKFIVFVFISLEYDLRDCVCFSIESKKSIIHIFFLMAKSLMRTFCNRSTTLSYVMIDEYPA